MTENDLVTWPKMLRTVNVTFFLTLNLTENDNCKRYDEYEYDRKRLLSTVHIYWPFFILLSTVKVKKTNIHSLLVRSSLFSHLHSVILTGLNKSSSKLKIYIFVFFLKEVLSLKCSTDQCTMQCYYLVSNAGTICDMNYYFWFDVQVCLIVKNKKSTNKLFQKFIVKYTKNLVYLETLTQDLKGLGFFNWMS